MKNLNQTKLILLAIALFALGIAVGLFFGTKRDQADTGHAVEQGPSMDNVTKIEKPSDELVTPSGQRVDISNDPSISRTKTIQGTLICLPNKNAKGPQTTECAYGLKAANGDNYAVTIDSSSYLSPELEQPKAGMHLEVTGLVVPIEAISSDIWFKYDIKGIIQVSSIKKI
jgi:hypothetical protein